MLTYTLPKYTIEIFFVTKIRGIDLGKNLLYLFLDRWIFCLLNDSISIILKEHKVISNIT